MALGEWRAATPLSLPVTLGRPMHEGSDPRGRGSQRIVTVIAVLILLGSGFLLVSRGTTSSSGAASSFTPTVAGITPSIHLSPALGGTQQWSMICQGGGSNVPARCIPQPPNLMFATGAWDAADNQFLAFGGDAANTYWSASMAFKFSSPHWTVLSPGTIPAGRANASMVYDSTDNYPLLVGGYTKNGSTVAHWLSDAWKYTGGNWVTVTVPGGFEKRTGGCMINVPLVSGHGGYVLLYGGSFGRATSFGSTYLTSTWEYAAGTWTNVTSTAGTLTPPGRMAAGCAYDSADSYGVLFGGLSAAGAMLNDTWEWNPAANASGSWHLLHANGAAGQPNPRFYPSMADIPTGPYVELFSGAYGTFAAPTVNPIGDFWQFSGGVWTNVTTTTISAGRLPCAGAGGYDGIFSRIPGVGALRVNGVCSNAANNNETFLYGPPLVTVQLAENYGEVLNGTAVTLYSNATGGTGAGTYTYSYSGLPPGCSTSNASLIVCTPNLAGKYTLSVTATDSAHESGTSRSYPLVVDPAGSVSATLSIGGAANTAIRPDWMQADLWSNWTANRTFAQDLNATLFRQFHYYGQLDKTNLSTGYQGAQYNGGTPLPYVTYNLSQYRTICQWIKGGCVIYENTPGETNDTGASVDDFKTFETKVGTLSYTGIGTESDNYNHYGIPFTSWSGSDNVAPTGLQLAVQVRTDYAIIHPLDPSAPFIEQLSSGNSFNKTLQYYAQNFSKIDCGIVSGIGMDFYPEQGNNYGNPNVAAFYSNITSLATRVALLDQAWTAGNSACPLPQLWLTEFRPSSGGSFTGDFAHDYLGTYNEVPFIAASVAQALTYGLQAFGTWAVFEDRSDQGAQAAGFSLINTSTLTPTPAYTLYSAGPLGHIPLGSATYLNLTGAPATAFAVKTANASSEGYLVANTNTTVPLVISTHGIATGFPWIVYNETSTGVVRTIYPSSSLPSSIFVPAFSITELVINETSAHNVPSSSLAQGGGALGAIFATPSGMPVSWVVIFVLAGIGVLFVVLWVYPSKGSKIRRR
jgi:hypothetical protein